ncbi:MAG TPA: hypothetical protein VIE39_10760 [Thermoanaerobaculia bacterium]
MNLALAGILLSFLTSAPENPRPLPFSDKEWKLEGEATRIVRDGDREVLQIETGEAARPDVRFEDGTIDVDVRVTRRRSFVYLTFRIVGDGQNEEVYLRPHKSGLSDAVQYAPVWQGQSAWQLYHGPGSTAAVEFEPGSWTPLRLVVQGRDAALFVGDRSKPALVARLAREPKAGGIALAAFTPANTPGSGPVASFANLVVRPGVVDFDFSPHRPKAADPGAGVVRSWAVSRALDPKLAEAEALPPAATVGDYRSVSTEPGGLLLLHRDVPLPQGGRIGVAVARISVRADKAGPRAFDLGFSDTAAVFVNGTPIFRCDARYSFDGPRREGLIGFDQARLYLPLAAGENEIAILISDRFGGWGLMARFLEPQGLRVEAR